MCESLGKPMVHEQPDRLNKRLEDVILSVIFLAAGGLLLFALIALAIKLETPGPVFFRQVRRGKGTLHFRVLKFRSMTETSRDVWAERQTVRNDPRVTRVGAILRRHSLDELPQVFNVLAGHMSIVGPRPHALGTNINGVPLEQLSECYLDRYKVKPGITGLAQVNGCRGNLDTIAKLHKRLSYDIDYIHQQTPRFDHLILIKTVGCLLGDSHAY